MAESLTDCLVSVRNDLSQMKKVKEYLESNTHSEGNCLVTWQTIEAFNAILATCSSQDSPEVEALDTLLDSFYYIARNNHQKNVWSNFGFEMGVVCVKILSVIEQTKMFDDLFRKLLVVIDVICEHTCDVWKSVARQIINIFINKKFLPSYLEIVLKDYICVVKKIDTFVLNNFAKQNLSLLKTLSMLVQGVGDFEIQMDIMELIFLHIPDKKLIEDFFTESRSDVKELFQSLHFVNFDDDSRLYLNQLNKSVTKRKVISLYCSVIYLGGCFVEPPSGKKRIWLDANKDSERLSLKCSDFQGNSDIQRIIYIQFSDLISVRFGNEMVKNENLCLVIQTRNLEKIYKEVNSDDVLCLALESDNTQEGILEFADFLNEMIRREEKKRRKTEVKLSQTLDNIFIDRETIGIEEEAELETSMFRCDLQDNAISSSSHKVKANQESDGFNLFDVKDSKPENPLIAISRELEKNLWVDRPKISPISPVKQNVVPETQELTPNSFIESLNKNLGLDSPETRPSFEDAIATVEFMGRSEEKKSHRLFRSPEQIFSLDVSERHEQEKENEPPQEEVKQPTKPTKTSKTVKQENSSPCKRVLRERKNLEVKLFNSQSEEYFRKSSNPGKNKKPKPPKLVKKKCISTRRKKTYQSFQKNKSSAKENPKKQAIDVETHVEANTRPSLLDPNGYTFKRWITPTTSERSNFWLKKLESLQSDKKVSDQVFEFDDSEIDLKKRSKPVGIRKNRKCTKQKGKRNPVNKSTLKEVKEIVKWNDWKTQPKEQKFQPGRLKTKVNSINPQGNNLETKSHKQEEKPIDAKKQMIETVEDVPEHFPESPHVEGLTQNSPEPETPLSKHTNYDYIAKFRSTSEESNLVIEDPSKEPYDDEDNEDEAEVEAEVESEAEAEVEVESSIEESEDDDANTKTRKRERSEEENSLTKALIKKKPKTLRRFRKLPPPPKIEHHDSLERLKRETDEIIETINKATNHLLNHVAKKEAEKVASYMKTAEEATLRLCENNDSEVRSMRIQKLISYFETGCSVSNYYESMNSELSKVRTAISTLAEEADTTDKITRISHRLRGMIEYEIDRSISYEMKMKKDRLMQLMSRMQGSVLEF